MRHPCTAWASSTRRSYTTSRRSPASKRTRKPLRRRASTGTPSATPSTSADAPSCANGSWTSSSAGCPIWTSTSTDGVQVSAELRVHTRIELARARHAHRQDAARKERVARSHQLEAIASPRPPPRPPLHPVRPSSARPRVLSNSEAHRARHETADPEADARDLLWKRLGGEFLDELDRS